MSQIDTYCRDLDTLLTSQIDYYEYLLSRYYNDTSIDLRANYTVPYYNVAGYNLAEDADLENSAYVNVTKSVIDTLVSKLANQKVRPYFNPINGTWKTKKTVKAVQQYFDVMFDNLHVNRIVREAFRNACIFGKGYIFFNPLNNKLSSLGAFQVATLLSEERYTDKTRCLIRYLNFPSHMVQDYTGETFTADTKTVNLRHYIDVQNHKQIIYIGNTVFAEKPYEPDVLPIIQMYYTDPVFGGQTTSVVKELDGIQTQINYINDQISETTQRNMANMFFVNEGSSLSPRDLSNKAGIVYSVKSPAGSGATQPVTQVVPRLCDPQWVELLNMYIKQAYDIIGISELSAMGKNILGDNASGAALQSMENIEGDRQQTQLDNYVHAYVDLANMIISVMPKDTDILPKAMNNSGMKWKDIIKQKDLFKVQYSAATSLSKDPAEKRKEVLQMSQVGLITADKISRYLDQPDLEDAYKEAASIADGVYQCIERAIENDEYDVPDWIDYELLAKNITITENELYSSINDNDKDDGEVMKALQKLRRLEENLFTTMQENGFVQSEQDEEIQESEEGIATGGDAVNVKDITTQMDTETPTSVTEMEEDENAVNPADESIA